MRCSSRFSSSLSRPVVLAPLLMASLATLLGASCNKAVQAPDAKMAPGPAPTSATGRSGCLAAALSLAADDVVADIDGQKITAKELGDEYQQKEAEALRTYCEAIDTLRTGAVDEKVNEVLVERAAASAGVPPDTYVQQQLADAAAPIAEADSRAFYDARKRPDAPPFEAVKEQVEAMMKQERMGEAVGALLSRLRTGAKVALTLPDVRPPAHEISIPPHAASAGAPDAKVTVVEFADFECPYCSTAAESVAALKMKYKDRVRFVYRHFPLSFHPHAHRAAEYAHCANVQGKFWAFHDGAYRQQKDLSDEALAKLSGELGLDAQKLATCLGDPATNAAIDADMEVARAVGVDGTPSFFVNGRRHQGAAGPDELGAAIERELAAAGAVVGG